MIVEPIEEQINGTQYGNIELLENGNYKITNIPSGYYAEEPDIQVYPDILANALDIISNKIVIGKNICGVKGNQLVLKQQFFTDVLASENMKTFKDSNDNTWNCRYLEINYAGTPMGICCYTNNFDQMECISCDGSNIVTMKVEPNGIPIIVRWDFDGEGIVWTENKVVVPLIIDPTVKCKYSGTVWGYR